MTPTDSLLPLLEHHFRWLSRAIRALQLDQARFELAPGRPSIAWQVGHLTAGADSIAEAVAACGAGLGPAFLARRREVHWGVVDTRGWEGLCAEWERIAARTAAGLATLAPADLDQPPAIAIRAEFAQRLATRRAFLAGEVFHFAYHLGQIGTLRAALGLPWD